MEAEPNLELSPVRVGEMLAGKYRVERLLGAGGMGVVVLARHVQLDQLVALKFLLAQSLSNPKVVARFEREARAVVKMKSEHVARVIDVGTMAETGAPYIVMEFLEGEDLAMAVQRRGPLPIAEAVDYVLQACEALAEAHGIGIVHRDLKPGNLFLTKRPDGHGLIKVLDFGISKVNDSREDLALTQTAEVVGSPKYMSPEQLRASRLADARSDIWSLGVILYELITADMPFMAETLAHLCAIVISEPPRPIRTLRADVPPGIESIIIRCLEKDPNKRFQTVADLAMALDPFVSTMQTSAAMRVRAVAAGSSGGYPSSPSSSNVIVGNHSSQSTSIGWGATELKPAEKGRGKWIAAIGVGVVALSVAGLVFFKFRPHDHASTDASHNDTTTAASSSASPSSTPSASAAPSDSTSTTPVGTASSSSATPISSATLISSAAPSASHTNHPATTTSKGTTTKKPPHPPNNTDDMPNERN